MVGRKMVRPENVGTLTAVACDTMGSTWNRTCWLCVMLPLVPVRVMVYTPAGVAVVVLIVYMVALPDAMVGLLNVMVASVGRPEADSATFPVKPSKDPTDKGTVPDAVPAQKISGVEVQVWAR